MRLEYRSGMLQSRNKIRFTSGYIDVCPVVHSFSPVLFWEGFSRTWGRLVGIGGWELEMSALGCHQAGACSRLELGQASWGPSRMEPSIDKVSWYRLWHCVTVSPRGGCERLVPLPLFSSLPFFVRPSSFALPHPPCLSFRCLAPLSNHDD